jgi:DNA mismatch repair protein MutS
LAKNNAKETPLMQQYNQIKAKYPGALLLFRVGDFYETFGEDAVKASQILGIVLTRRANGSAAYIELAGFPHHSIETYLPKLVRAGQRVAICDQLEDPKATKTIVKRGVTELVTPGVSYNDNILNQKANNFLATLHFEKNGIGIALLDISTGEFLVTQGNPDYIDKLLQGFRPSEVIFSKQKQKEFSQHFGDRFYTYGIDDWAFSNDFATETLLKHFEVKNLKGFGNLAIIAAGVTLHYINETEHRNLQHITGISRIEPDKYLWLDRFTIRNLELLGSNNDHAVSLVDVLDLTSSPMGARLLRKWMIMPLKEAKPIEERLGVVEFFYNNPDAADELIRDIKQIGDLERLISKVGLLKANPRELIQLKRALQATNQIKKYCEQTDSVYLRQIAEQLNPCLLIREKIERELHAEPPALLQKGGVIADGVDAELDRLRKIAFGGKEFLLEIQKREAETTGIPSLKVAIIWK